MNHYLLSAIVVQIVAWSLLAQNITGEINLGLMPMPFFAGSLLLMILAEKYTKKEVKEI